MEANANGTITGINGNIVSVAFEEAVRQNEVAYVVAGDKRLKSEVIRIEGNTATLQVYEETRGLTVGQIVEFSGDLLTVEVGPGLLGQVFDGLQNPLHGLAKDHGFFLPAGVNLPALPRDAEWDFTPRVDTGAEVRAGDVLGHVPEGIFEHHVMAPFDLAGTWTVREIAPRGNLASSDKAATLAGPDNETREVGLVQTWPVRMALSAYARRMLPEKPLITGVRIIDTMFPVARGGTYCTPGPFGAGKTVLQQITARHALVDVVIMAACGERAGEVVETLREFPKLEDPRTGRSLMERTIIVANTSSMPVAARESSVYTAVTMGEYYRQMGLDVLLLADSTSRWAQAMREISGRLEEIPGEEAFPAYLESRIAGFYERAGLVELNGGGTGSLTIGGTVSPAGGTFEEPVTQATLKVVGSFHGLSRDRANARRFPSIDPHESWSTYPGVIDPDKRNRAATVLAEGRETEQMMKVIGEEGTSLADYVVYLKSEFLDAAYLQQNAFDEVDAATDRERQVHVFDLVDRILDTEFDFEKREDALKFFQRLRHAFVNWNYKPWDSDGFKQAEQEIRDMVDEAGKDDETSR
ncbi:MAG: V-type ATP synthase subunit A [Desulfatibacillaceae bacterium]